MTQLKTYLSKKRRKKILLALAFFALLIASGLGSEFSLSSFLRGLPDMFDLVRRMFTLDFAYIASVMDLVFETFLMAFVSSAFGVFLACIITFFLPYNTSPSQIVSKVLSAVFSVFRTLPSLIWAALLVSFFSAGRFSGLLALSIISFFMSTKLIKEYIEAMDKDDFDFYKSLGIGKGKIYYKIILTKMRKFIVSTFLLCLESNIRSASILGLVGAGGIGQRLWLELNHMNYDRVSSIIFMLLILIFLIDLVSQKLREVDIKSPIKVNDLGSYKRSKILKKIFFALFLIALFLVIKFSINITYERFLLGLKQGSVIIGKIFDPDFAYLSRAVPAAVESAAIAIFASLMGAIVSFIFTPFTAVNIAPSKKVSVLFKVLINVIRTFPPIISAIIFFRGLGPGPFAGALALTVYTSGMLSKLYFEYIEDIPSDSIMSMQALGLSPFTMYTKMIYPKTYRSFLGFVLYRLESNIRNSSVLGLIGAGGIGTLLSMNISWRNWNRVGSLLLVSSVMIIFFDYLSSTIRKKLL